MSDYAINLLDKIINYSNVDSMDNKHEMDDAFAIAINNKVVDAIDAKKIEVAQNIYGYSNQVSVDASDEQFDDEVGHDTTETSDDNGTEEV